VKTGIVLFFVFLSVSVCSQTSNHERIKSIPQLKRFAFGSCNDQRDPQPAWKGLIKDTPELFIWGGDNIYADTHDPDRIKYFYDLQNLRPDYAFFKSMTPIIGTWDDHDFGYDRSRGNYVHKELSQHHALDFLEEPIDSPRRLQKGIYTSYDFGQGDQRTKIILLDNRFFKDLDREAPLLGTEQWAWLEEELKNSDAHLHFIMSGITVSSPWYPGSEEWKDYPKESAKFFSLLERYKTKGVVLISGDKHFANIQQRQGYLEFMSSGMTHTVPHGIRKFLAGHFGGTSFFGLSYGLIEITWMGNMPTLKMHIKNRHGRSVFINEYHLTNNEWFRDDIPSL